MRLNKTVRFSNGSLPAKTFQAIFGCLCECRATKSLHALSKTGKPLIQYPIKARTRWTAYARVDDFLNGHVAAQMLLDACGLLLMTRPTFRPTTPVLENDSNRT